MGTNKHYHKVNYKKHTPDKEVKESTAGLRK